MALGATCQSRARPAGRDLRWSYGAVDLQIDRSTSFGFLFLSGHCTYACTAAAAACFARRPRASDLAGCAGDGSGRWRRALLLQHAQLHCYVLCSGWQEQWGRRETYSGFVSEYWFAAIR